MYLQREFNRYVCIYICIDVLTCMYVHICMYIYICVEREREREREREGKCRMPVYMWR